MGFLFLKKNKLRQYRVKMNCFMWMAFSKNNRNSMNYKVGRNLFQKRVLYKLFCEGVNERRNATNRGLAL